MNEKKAGKISKNFINKNTVWSLKFRFPNAIEYRTWHYSIFWNKKKMKRKYSLDSNELMMTPDKNIHVNNNENNRKMKHKTTDGNGSSDIDQSDDEDDERNVCVFDIFVFAFRIKLKGIFRFAWQTFSPWKRHTHKTSDENEMKWNENDECNFYSTAPIHAVNALIIQRNRYFTLKYWQSILLSIIKTFHSPPFYSLIPFLLLRRLFVSFSFTFCRWIFATRRWRRLNQRNEKEWKLFSHRVDCVYRFSHSVDSRQSGQAEPSKLTSKSGKRRCTEDDQPDSIECDLVAMQAIARALTHIHTTGNNSITGK